ncbi:hypothetical protein QYM36_018169 [Artemia franciscana]|nr:hypothetical protein QYM36_018169 [Artemia franciscana]
MKCKEKWKSLRDSYVKTRRRTKDQQNGESSLPQPKEWKWTKHLMFLEDYLDPKGSCSDDNYVTLKRAENSITNDYSDVNGYEDPVSIQETNIVYFQDREDNCVEFDPASVSPFPTSESGSDYNNISRPQKRKRVSNNELKSDKSMKYEADSHFGCTEDANVRKSVVPELVQNKMDGEAAFGISVANDLMKLNESQRAYAKYKIQELLYKITSGITSPSHEQA